MRLSFIRIQELMLSILYAQSFNRCFLKAAQKDNFLYLLDETIITKPFALLAHATARYQTFIREKDK